MPEYCPLDETFKALEEDLDRGKLVEYALKMNSPILLKRLGYCLERQGYDIYPQVKNKIHKRYDLFYSGRKKTKEKNKKWKLFINGAL